MAAAPALLLVATGAWAAAPEDNGPVSFQAAIPVPVKAANKTGGMYSFDISYVDQKTQTGYIADRSNQAIDVFNAKTDRFVKQISAKPAFAGASAVSAELSGPNGVLTANSCIIATDAGDRVVSFTLGGSQVGNVRIANVPGRADELAFDPANSLLLIITPAPNGSANPPSPYGTLVKVGAGCRLTVGKTIPLPFATNGAEQPQWDPNTGRFFLSIPNVSNTDPSKGELVRINPISAAIDAVYAVNSCAPAGLAINTSNNTLLLGCSVTFDTAGDPWSGTDTNTAAPLQLIYGTDGFLQAVVPGPGSSDEVWYNSGDDHFYTGSSSSPFAPSVVVAKATSVSQGAAVLGVIDGTSQRLDQLVPTFNVPKTAPHPAGSAHSVTADSKNNRVFVPLSANNAYPGCLTGCVAVYTRNDVDLTGATD
ncbi:MAG: hypothetical protein ACREE9_11150 [Stellaceae bacterium]